MNKYKKKDTIVQAYQVVQAMIPDGETVATFGTITNAGVGDWILMGIANTMVKLTNTEFTNKYELTHGNAELAGTDLT